MIFFSLCPNPIYINKWNDKRAKQGRHYVACTFPVSLFHQILCILVGEKQQLTSIHNVCFNVEQSNYPYLRLWWQFSGDQGPRL